MYVLPVSLATLEARFLEVHRLKIAGQWPLTNAQSDIITQGSPLQL